MNIQVNAKLQNLTERKKKFSLAITIVMML